MDRQSEMQFGETQLTGRAVVAITGADAAGFLQGLVTADVQGLAEGQSAYAALLTPQGKILHDFFVLRRDAGFLLDVAAGQLDSLVQRLGIYKLRAAVTITGKPELNVIVSPEAGDYADPRTAAIGYRAMTERTAAGPDGPYHAARIALGLADSERDLGSGEYFPHEANLDQLGAVSFTKGCYVGQEVVSRMEHRGTARSRILPVSVAGSAPAKGAAVEAGGKPVGTVLSSAGETALAILRLDRLHEATEPLLTEGRTVRVIKPDWARFEI